MVIINSIHYQTESHNKGIGMQNFENIGNQDLYIPMTVTLDSGKC